jgi:chemotaxis protein methyltransferase CheR
MIAITPEMCDRLRRWLQRMSGIWVPTDRNYLFQERLSTLSLELRHSIPEIAQDLNKLVAHVLTCKPGTPLVDNMITAMTTNESMWFRDGHPFTALSEAILPERAPQERRIWSAACSFGQEIYSIAMLLEEGRAWSGGLRSWDLMATDIDEAALERGLAAMYRRHEISRGLSPERLELFFKTQGSLYLVDSAIRQAVTFQRRNLLEDWAHEAPWDVILCRNVLIYFTEEDRMAVIERLVKRLRSNGYLILGAMEIYPAGLPGLTRRRFGSTTVWQKP